MYIQRSIEEALHNALAKGKSILLLGPRQTGKTTLIRKIPSDRYLSLANPQHRIRYEKDPALLTQEIEALCSKNHRPLIVIDEIQKIPILLDAVQDLIDRKIAHFILTGSSARKLRRHHNINLLPGRVIPLRLDPFSQEEISEQIPSLTPLLLDGALPEIVLEPDVIERETLLEAYVTLYLEEEIRAEGLVREIGPFARFLEFASSESGKIVNFSKLSQEIGVTHTTIAGYYQILEDCLVAERIEPIVESTTRHKLSKMQKYLLYDLGVRRIAAREGRLLPKESMGHLLEQYVGLELIRLLRLTHPRARLKYWRDPSGPEVDWIIEHEGYYTPIEVKWTDSPDSNDLKHLKIFMKEYHRATQGYIVCQTPHVLKMEKNIVAIPWNHLASILDTTCR